MQSGSSKPDPFRRNATSSLISPLVGACFLAAVVLFLVLLFSGFLGDKFENDIIVAGVVVDERGVPVIGASVTLLPPAAVTTTNVAGFFQMQSNGSGPQNPGFMLDVSKPGLKTLRMNLGAGEHSTLRIVLETETGHGLEPEVD
jgi:hypothetical protein